MYVVYTPPRGNRKDHGHGPNRRNHLVQTRIFRRGIPAMTNVAMEAESSSIFLIPKAGTRS